MEENPLEEIPEKSKLLGGISFDDALKEASKLKIKYFREKAKEFNLKYF